MFEVIMEPSCDEEHFVARALLRCATQEIRSVVDHNDIRRHPSRFLHELGDFGP
jgi:hypothetical protein